MYLKFSFIWTRIIVLKAVTFPSSKPTVKLRAAIVSTKNLIFVTDS